MRWRSVLFVPANRPELAAKAVRSGPDVVVVDLEDAVPPNEKADARQTARQAVADVVGRVPVCVRVNPPQSRWFDADLASLPDGLAAIVVPKWERPVDVSLPVIAGLETVLGVADSRAVLGTPVVACYFGAEDFVADMGGERTASNTEVLYARSKVAVTARLAGIPSLDMVTLDFRDSGRFSSEAAGARALGFAGKLCIHPDQVPLANQAFTPSPEEVDRAVRMLAAFDLAGGAVISFEGQMVDEVVAVQARNLIARAEP
jgi:citrate lyase subunit beta / citryl-CoA lyase